ncbi:MAG: penicillin-binding protein 2 [Coriobacteriia bacterium]|nr:penicillin-binding protein 2 [Coriobacteriia bacterium]
MNVYLIAAIIGISVFVVVMVVAIVAWFIYGKYKTDPVSGMSFERTGTYDMQDVNRLGRAGNMAPLKGGPDRRGRFYAFGALVAVLFGTLTVKLWTMQVISSDKYSAEATDNMTRDVSTPAFRGRILDRNGVELITNRASIVLTCKKSILETRGLVHRLSLILGIPKGVLRRNIRNDAAGVQADRIIAHDVPMRTVAFIKEHPTLFEGVNIEKRTMRHYPLGNTAAHILGYTGPVTEDQLKSQITWDVVQFERGDVVGKDGAEYAFDRILRGVPGTRTYKVDSSGLPIELINEIEPTSGNDVCLTIDSKLQKETDRILMETIIAARSSDNDNARAGALICLDVKEGGVLAASSYPTFNPADLIGGISSDLWEQLTKKTSNYPLNNRVISGLYPAASTFKAFSSMAGLNFGVIQGDIHHECKGFWDKYGKEWGQRCWIYPGGHGWVGLEEAINHSCDIFFYNVGAEFHKRWYALPDDEKEDVFQDYIRTWGFGQRTGIDLPGEGRGRVPTAAWKHDAFPDTPEESQWQPGDMTNMCIGQGDILVTPLQIANGYATIARREAVKPHIFHKVIDKDGNDVVSHKLEPDETQPEFSDAALNRVIDGLMRVVNREKIFSPIPVDIAGKSGTAEVAGKDPYAWFVAYGPVYDPEYCVACLIEEGGQGSSTAIMGVLHTFAAIYNKKLGAIVARKSESDGER